MFGAAALNLRRRGWHAVTPCPPGAGPRQTRGCADTRFGRSAVNGRATGGERRVKGSPSAFATMHRQVPSSTVMCRTPLSKRCASKGLSPSRPSSFHWLNTHRAEPQSGTSIPSAASILNRRLYQYSSRNVWRNRSRSLSSLRWMTGSPKTRVISAQRWEFCVRSSSAKALARLVASSLSAVRSLLSH